MDPDTEEVEVFSDTEVLTPLTPEEEEEKEEKEEEEEEEEKEKEKEKEEEDVEEDARIYNAWLQRYRGGKERTREEQEDVDSEGGRTGSRGSFEPLFGMRADRRASLPCAATLSAMQLSRLHSSTQAPVTARVLLRRTSSRRLLPSQQEAPGPAPERRPSLIPTIPEAMAPERRGQFRRRNAMSLSDADGVCLLCHNDLHGGSGGTRELQCTHTFHKECIEERLWRKQSCPTCHVQVSAPQPVY